MDGMRFRIDQILRTQRETRQESVVATRRCKTVGRHRLVLGVRVVLLEVVEPPALRMRFRQFRRQRERAPRQLVRRGERLLRILFSALVPALHGDSREPH